MNSFSSNPMMSGMPPSTMGPSFGQYPSTMGPSAPMPTMGMPNPFSMNSSFGGVAPPAGAVPMSGEVVLEISRLLDMPVQETFNGNLKQYRVRAYDDNNREIGRTEELAGTPENFVPSESGEVETVRLGREGIMRLETDSPVIHLQVEYAGGFLGNMRIGRCQIARGDQRSRSVWPYALSNKKAEMVGCGIELKISEAGFPPMPGMGPPTGPMGAPFNTMSMQTMGPPMGAPMTMPPMAPVATMPPMGMGGPPMMGGPPTAGMMGGTPPGTPPGSFRTMGPSGPGGPNGPSFQTMPHMAAPPPYGTGTPPGTPPSGGPMQPSFHTMPPAAMGGGYDPRGPKPQGGQGSFMEPQTIPPQMMPPGSINPMMSQPSMPGSMPMMPPGSMNPMMPPGSMNPMMSHPSMNPMMNETMTRNCRVKWAFLKPSGQNVTELVNQLIHANGVFNPTRGASLEDIFHSHEELQVHGPGVRQADYPGGGTHIKEFPVTFSSGAKPPYNLFQLFNPAGLPPVSHARMFPSNVASQNVQVVALIDIDKIKDLPAPSSGDGEVTLTLERPHSAAAGTGKAMATAGPFPTETKGDLRSVSCDGKLVARLTMQDLAQGYVEFRVCATYKGGWTSFGSTQQIGATAPFYVTWKPEPFQFVSLLEPVSASSPAALLKAGNPAAVGSISLSHRFAQDTPDLYQRVNPSAAGTAKAVKSNNLAKQQSDEINGQSGLFKKGGQGDIFESAALAVEGQNRALHQRIQLAKSALDLKKNRMDSEKSGLVMRYPNGYRNWKDLDSVFITMGPNYVAQSSEIGVPFCRVYEDKTSVWKELTKKAVPAGLGMPTNPMEEATMKTCIEQLSPVNPQIAHSTLRPIVCKDVNSISRADMDAKDRKPLLSVKVHSALNLRDKSGFMQGKVQPKVIIEIPGKPAAKWTSALAMFGGEEKTPPAGRFETRPAQDGVHVEWNQEGTITGYNYGDDIHVKVVDKDFIGWEEHLGEARLPGNDFYPSPFFAQVPLFNGGSKGNTSPRGGGSGAKGASLLLEVRVIEPDNVDDMWPPYPPMYAPTWDVNRSDAETQRLANWDIHQNAKLAFADVSTNYQMNEDIWGAMDTGKSIDEKIMKMERPDWRPQRVKDECLMA